MTQTNAPVQPVETDIRTQHDQPIDWDLQMAKIREEGEARTARLQEHVDEVTNALNDPAMTAEIARTILRESSAYIRAGLPVDQPKPAILETWRTSTVDRGE